MGSTTVEDKKTMTYKIGDRIDISVDLKLDQDLVVNDINEELYSGAIDEATWKIKVKERLATKGLNYGEFDAVISNSGLDRHGERILVEGIDINQMRTNAPMPWAHDYINLPLGKWIKVWRSAKQLFGRGRIDYDIYDFADTAYKMLLRGTLNAVSIGGLVKELDAQDPSIIKKMEMLEASLVPIGAHPDALIISRSLNMSESEFKDQYRNYVKQTLVDKLSDLDDDEINDAVKVLKSLVARLEESTASADAKSVKRIKHVVIRDAQAVVTQSQRVVKTIKLKAKDSHYG